MNDRIYIEHTFTGEAIAELRPQELVLRAEISRAAGLTAGLEYEFDYNNAARVVVSVVLGEIPYAGQLLSALVDIFWPDEKQDVWGEIADRVEALIDKKISAEVMQDVRDALTGLHNVSDDYAYAAKNFPKDKAYVSEKFNVANGHFLHDLPRFQSSGYEVLLLPLFAQFANLHLALLRDGAAFGRDWGWSDELVADTRKKLTESIDSYSDYVTKTFEAGYESVKKTAPEDKRRMEPFNTVNRYLREMTITVKDFQAQWKYFDISRYPEPVKVYLDREVYSDAVGTCYDSPFYIPSRPAGRIRNVTVWGWDRIDAVKVDYPEGGGPDGVTSTGRMGNAGGGSDQRPHGGSFDLSSNPIVGVQVMSGDIVNAMSFQFADGADTGMMGGNYRGGQKSTFSYAAQILSSIRVMGVSRFYGSADCAVFGFKFDERATKSQDLYARLYRTSPRDITPEELIEQFNVEPEHAQTIREAAEREQWGEQRARYWARKQERLNRAD